MDSSLELAARSALAGLACAGPDPQLVHLGNRGGFSGARLWRVEGTGGPFCLRAWPAGAMAPERLDHIHRLMRSAREAGLDFVPDVFVTPEKSTRVARAGRLWDLTRWLPGRADFQDWPTPERLAAACTALARLHHAWADYSPGGAPCPGIQRRLDRSRDWLALLHSGWHPWFSAAGADDVDRLARQAWHLIRDRMGDIPRRLAPWSDLSLTVQPCLCDIWHDHVLFEGDRVTGIVDYGSIKMDHVAVDLARLLGSLARDDTSLRAAGMDAYKHLRSLTSVEEGLVAALDETGVLVGAANWVQWLYRDGRSFEDRTAVAARLAEIVGRLNQRA
jgi:homoserine kinase type II